MATTVRIAAWNANGLNNHIEEITVFLEANKIDILLISESHILNKALLRYHIIQSTMPTIPTEQLTQAQP
jgi:exonuclease III